MERLGIYEKNSTSFLSRVLNIRTVWIQLQQPSKSCTASRDSVEIKQSLSNQLQAARFVEAPRSLVGVEIEARHGRFKPLPDDVEVKQVLCRSQSFFSKRHVHVEIDHPSKYRHYTHIQASKSNN